MDADFTFEAVSPALSRAFEVRRFRRPSVLWLNDRWFLECGTDLARAGARKSAERTLLERFAVSAPSHFDPPAGFGETAAPLCCDSYGAPNGSVHGGSGRVGGRDGLQAKGIGRTPLAAVRADDFHSNGCLWLEEALRETVFSEIVANEFPFGGVPVIALIDTGEQLYWPDGQRAPFRAIMVRPEVIRLAHFQRSVFFGTAGFRGSDQELDAIRTRDVWRWFDHADDQPRNNLRLTMTEVFRRIGIQYGYAHVSRLWPGPFYSSNVAIDGRLLDFGSMRWLTFERNYARVAADRDFGGETEFVVNTARSIASLSRKYARRALASADLVQSYKEGVTDGRRVGLERFGRRKRDNGLALLWQSRFVGNCQRLMTVWALRGRR
ncbi:hypothetical protein, partial [Sphingomonas bacterium]|uniref:hypothetical protein n=1 Tax=Sphingomonas bacterium TaxID=1895847 RepID=UPI001C2DBBD2